MGHDFFQFSNPLINRTCSHFYLPPLGINLQLSLEQHGFEICGPFMRTFFFNNKYCSPAGSGLVDFMYVELQIWRNHAWRRLTMGYTQVCDYTEGRRP